ncbi:Hypothetical predicted protein [Octopus vulgaris]|uniref:Uncharacterized protein n=1 Tax=Octopus vulgaris TaxID=6645 RepID=A0AA36B4H5_OCTVU|nr:Hypothetical predicted protein [Octopus vulgaris]
MTVEDDSIQGIPLKVLRRPAQFQLLYNQRIVLRSGVEQIREDISSNVLTGSPTFYTGLLSLLIQRNLRQTLSEWDMNLVNRRFTVNTSCQRSKENNWKLVRYEVNA